MSNQCEHGQLARVCERCEDKAEIERLRAERDELDRLLIRCRPVVESKAALMDSMARHMEGGFPEKDVWSANQSVHFLHQLLDEIDAALRGKGE